MENNWQFKTLENLEKDRWETQSSSRLVERIFALRKIPLRDFSIEDLRLMIGQQISLFYLIPLAIEVLRLDIFAEGDFYEGDLLQQVLRVDPGFWKNNKSYWLIIDELLSEKLTEIKQSTIDISVFKTAIRYT